MRKSRKIIATALALSVMLTLFFGVRSISAKDVTVVLDGKEIEFDVEPRIIDGRTMVPLRKIFEEIGAKVKWDGDTQTVTARKNTKTVTLAVDSADLTIDNGKTDSDGNPVTETVTLDVPASVVSGRTLVPARAVSESFGLDVDWDSDSRKVIITSRKEKDDSWKENTGEINLSEQTVTGDGVEFSDGKITVTKGGDFTVTGTFGGSITVSAEEKVKLRLSGASITSSGEPCIYIENADKAYITVTDGTQNVLKAENCDSGAIYAKDNLEIRGKGSLSVTSADGHGIKASDNLTVENGDITIDAAGDGIHVNDTFKMTGGSLDITAAGDGIDSDSIVDITGGKISIETTAVPIDSAETEFESSSKGIKAEWILCVSDGDIAINSASHAIHCQDEIQIDGGTFSVSSKYEKGITAHGNVTIDGSDTYIDITKSTEGIESKNILTVNDGTIKVVSTDDALNATGGNSGSMGMGGGFGGQRPDIAPPDGNEKPGGETAEMFADGGERDNRKPGKGGNGRPGGMKPNGGMGVPPDNNGTPPENEFTPPDNDNMPPENGFTPPDDGGAPPENGFTPPDDGGAPPDNGFTPPDGELPEINGGERPDGGKDRNMKNCLVINGGYLELYAGDDCLDSNGNLIINGGTVKASNPNGTFAGPFAVIDPDGQTTVGESATLIFAAGSGDERSLNLSQNTIIVYCEKAHDANDKITVSDFSGNTVLEYAPPGSFGAVLISSPELEIGETYTVTIGDETHEVELNEQTVTVGTRANSTGFGHGGPTFGRERERQPQ